MTNSRYNCVGKCRTKDGRLGVYFWNETTKLCFCKPYSTGDEPSPFPRNSEYETQWLFELPFVQENEPTEPPDSSRHGVIIPPAPSNGSIPPLPPIAPIPLPGPAPTRSPLPRPEPASDARDRPTQPATPKAKRAKATTKPAPPNASDARDRPTQPATPKAKRAKATTKPAPPNAKQRNPRLHEINWLFELPVAGDAMVSSSNNLPEKIRRVDASIADFEKRLQKAVKELGRGVTGAAHRVSAIQKAIAKAMKLREEYTNQMNSKGIYR